MAQTDTAHGTGRILDGDDTLTWLLDDNYRYLDIYKGENILYMLDWQRVSNEIKFSSTDSYKDGPVVFNGTKEECIAFLQRTHSLDPEVFLMEVLL